VAHVLHPDHRLVERGGAEVEVVAGDHSVVVSGDGDPDVTDGGDAPRRR